AGFAVGRGSRYWVLVSGVGGGDCSDELCGVLVVVRCYGNGFGGGGF
ncbi:hypothetical protein A2U01_0103120, partial [Trifolium medium]|nr:hypothetical protein [Trifolium medium]